MQPSGRGTAAERPSRSGQQCLFALDCIPRSFVLARIPKTGFDPMTGRPPKPSALKILNGSAAHHPERVNAAEPKGIPLTAVPEPPYDLSALALGAWRRNASAAVTLGVLTAADLDTLAVACETFADYKAALADDDWHRADAARKFYVTTLGKFGLNASDRTRIHVTPPVAVVDPILALLTPIRPRRRA